MDFYLVALFIFCGDFESWVLSPFAFKFKLVIFVGLIGKRFIELVEVDVPSFCNGFWHSINTHTICVASWGKKCMSDWFFYWVGAMANDTS